MAEVPLTGQRIRELLREVAAALPSGVRHTVILVGGSLLAWHELRDSTVDADTVAALPEDVKRAAAIVAHERHLPETWLNDRAAMFRPATLRTEECEVLLDLPSLLVLGAPLRQVFLMKLFAYREPDRDDLVRLWPRAGFTSPVQAAAEFELAYPHVAPDPYLGDLIARLAAASST